MKIGIVGGGVVGRATARAFIEHVEEVKVYDLMKERRTHGILDVLTCDLVFVCLPTPQKKDSLECDLSHIENFFAARFNSSHVNFVLRSTVPIGTTKRLSEQYNIPNLVHSPEFLTARCAVTDAHLPSRNIVGVPNAKQVPWTEDGAGRRLHDLYSRRFPGIPVFNMTSDESEAVKLFLNGFFATKIAYFNEVNALARKLDLDWDRVIEGVLSDGRVAHSHTKVPGPDGKYGFGGECLIKDLNSLTYQLTSNRCNESITEAAAFRNLSDRKRVF